MAVEVFSSAAIPAGPLPAAENVIATANVSAITPENRGVVIRGHVKFTGNAVAGTVQIRVRQGTLAGNIVYDSGLITAPASVTGQVVFEGEDDTDWIFTNGNYVVTGVDSAGAGTVNGGYMAVELIP